MAIVWKNKAISAGVIFAVWLMLRVAFFEGYWGIDDIPHVVYAMRPRVPIYVFECRLLYNMMVMAAYALFGISEWVSALPTLFASLVMVLTVWVVGRKRFGDAAGFIGALALAMVALDVGQSTVPMANPVSAAFAGLGTVCLLYAKQRRDWIAGGILLGLSINTHMATAFYFGPVLVVMFASSNQHRFRNSLLMLCSAVTAFIVAEATLSLWFGGNLTGRFQVIANTHLNSQLKVIGPTLADGSVNPEWFTWPLQRLFISREFGLVCGLCFIGSLYFRRQFKKSERTLAALVGFAWLYINFGTQELTGYSPLDHQMRYWYPMMVPLGLLIAATFRQLKSRPWVQAAFVAALLWPLPFMVSLAGPWGQRVEVSRALLAHVQENPDQTFLTDVYTYQELYVINAGQNPPNVVVWVQGEAACHCDPPWHTGAQEIAGYLVNERNFDRPYSTEFTEHIRTRVNTQPISAPQYRPLAACLPKRFVSGKPWWIRCPPALLGTARSPQ